MTGLPLGRNSAASGDHGEIRFYCWHCMAEWTVTARRVDGQTWKLDDANADLCDGCGGHMVPISEYVEERAAAAPTDTTEEN